MVHDKDPEALEQFRGTPAKRAASVAEIARAADVVILSLPNSTVVKRVVSGEGGLEEGFSEGKVLIDTSSSRPSSTRGTAAHLAKKGVHMLDAPVSGGVVRAREGALAVMVGGEKEVLDRCFGILNSFGEQIFHVGAQGAGHLAKALNNLLSATTLASAAEAVLLGAKAGLEPEKLIEVVNASSGRSASTEVKFPRYVLNRAFDDGFGIGLMNKDIKIALETAEEFGFPMLIGSTSGQVWRTAVAQGFGLESHTAIYAFLERLVGQQNTEQKTD